MEDVREALPKHKTKKYNRRALAMIDRVILHHVGVKGRVTAEVIARFHIQVKYEDGKPVPDSDWPGIGYHFYIREEGTIYWTQDLEVVAYHAGPKANLTGVGVCLEGDFREGRVPTVKQIAGLRETIAFVKEKVGAWPRLEPHYNYVQTECPGVAYETAKDLLYGQRRYRLVGGWLSQKEAQELDDMLREFVAGLRIEETA